MIKLDKKRKIKSAIDQGKAIPTELRNDARELKHEMENDIETLEERYDIIQLRIFCLRLSIISSVSIFVISII